MYFFSNFSRKNVYTHQVKFCLVIIDFHSNFKIFFQWIFCKLILEFQIKSRIFIVSGGVAIGARKEGIKKHLPFRKRSLIHPNNTKINVQHTEQKRIQSTRQRNRRSTKIARPAEDGQLITARGFSTRENSTQAAKWRRFSLNSSFDRGQVN